MLIRGSSGPRVARGADGLAQTPAQAVRRRRTEPWRGHQILQDACGRTPRSYSLLTFCGVYVSTPPNVNQILAVPEPDRRAAGW